MEPPVDGVVFEKAPSMDGMIAELEPWSAGWYINLSIVRFIFLTTTPGIGIVQTCPTAWDEIAILD